MRIIATSDPDTGWLAQQEYHLAAAGLFICFLEIWMVTEALTLLPRIRGVLEDGLPAIPRGFPVIVESSEPQGEGGRSC